MTDPHRFLQMACCRRSLTCAQELHGCDRTKVPFRQLCPREVSQLIRVLQVLRQMLEAGTGKAIIYQHVLFLWVFPCVSTMGDPQVTMGLILKPLQFCMIWAIRYPYLGHLLIIIV